MDRILRQTAATITITFEFDGAPTDTDDQTATIVVTASDGSQVTAGSALRQDIGVYSFTLSTADTALLDKLTANWTGTFNGSLETFTTEVEIVGGFLISLAEMRADRDLANDTKYPTSKLIDGREYAEEEIEQAAGRAFVPRYRLQTLRGSGVRDLLLDRPDIRSIRSVTVDGTALSSTDLTQLVLSANGDLWRPNFWSQRSIITVGYEYGLDQPPRAIKNAALIVAKQFIVGRVMDDRAIQRATPDGPVYIATPGFNGMRFGIPEVDAAIAAYGDTVHVG